MGNDLRAAEERSDPMEIGRHHLLLHAVGAEAGDLAGDKDVDLVDRIAEVMPGVAANDEGTCLAHEGAHMAHRATDHDGDALHRNAAARAGVDFDHANSYWRCQE